MDDVFSFYRSRNPFIWCGSIEGMASGLVCCCLGWVGLVGWVGVGFQHAPMAVRRSELEEKSG